MSLKPGVNYSVPVHIHLDHTAKLMIVKSNVVFPYQFGNKMAPVLKVILPPQVEAQQLERFDTLEWMPVSDKRFEEVTVTITDEEGDKYDFQDHGVSMILKFRPLQN